MSTAGDKIPFFDVQSCVQRLKREPSSVMVSSPQEVSYFSRTCATEYIPLSRKSLKKLTVPVVPSSLKDGYDSFIRKDQNSSTSLLPVRESLQQSGIDIYDSIDFLTFRNNLNKMALTPYNHRDGWKIRSSVEGNLIVLDICNEESKDAVQNENIYEYYGYKFEELCCGSDKGVVDANEEFCSIVKTKIGKHRLLISAQVDCWDEEKLLGDALFDVSYPINRYVELKTMKQQNMRYLDAMKYLRFWIQCFMVGIPHIYIGFRDDQQGTLVDMKYVSVRNIPSWCRTVWDANVCLGFMEEFLHFIASFSRAFPQRQILWEYVPQTRKVLLHWDN
eukprot:jgi/Galph1/456/GphlegSOOS_G5219.1